ncbi:MAG: DUF452 family protein [Mediterranea sp.]|jgi:biotin synthesis protein BioG|nr:DUF452 family protein [Mediterranea sp.]
MKQTFIVNEGNPRLLLFFAGWGADETPFKEYRPQGCDYLICYDYRTLTFDSSLLDGYNEVNVVGWSMGVWAATHVLGKLSGETSGRLPRLNRSVALNGTPFPADETRGIPPAIYRGTLEGLTGASLNKFLRRMCKDGAAYKAFLQVTPRRPLEELRDELIAIEKVAASQPLPAFHWTKAVVGTDDRIIPPANQLNCWQELSQLSPSLLDACEACEGLAHYDEPMFHHYLQEAWTND